MRQSGVDFGAVAYQKQRRDLLARLQCPHGPFDNDPAAVVATHDIHCDSHNKDRARRELFGARRGRLGPRLDRDNLSSLVKAASRANPVWNVRRGALRASAQLRQSQNAVVGAAHPLAAV
jgi:hypothetical protein